MKSRQNLVLLPVAFAMVVMGDERVWIRDYNNHFEAKHNPITADRPERFVSGIGAAFKAAGKLPYLNLRLMPKC